MHSEHGGQPSAVVCFNGIKTDQQARKVGTEEFVLASGVAQVSCAAAFNPTLDQGIDLMSMERRYSTFGRASTAQIARCAMA